MNKGAPGQTEAADDASASRPEPVQTAQQNRQVGLHYVTDTRGRQIGLRKLSALLRFDMRRVAGATDSNNFAAMIDYFSAAVVAEIDGIPEAPPQTLKQVRAMIAQLDTEGMEVVGEFVLVEIGITPELLEQAKNSQATPS
jgi:hypothetical protein